MDVLYCDITPNTTYDGFPISTNDIPFIGVISINGKPVSKDSFDEGFLFDDYPLSYYILPKYKMSEFNSSETDVRMLEMMIIIANIRNCFDLNYMIHILSGRDINEILKFYQELQKELYELSYSYSDMISLNIEVQLIGGIIQPMIDSGKPNYDYINFLSKELYANPLDSNGVFKKGKNDFNRQKQQESKN